MLGLYVSDDPLFGVEHVLVGAADMSIAALHADAAADGQTVTVAGILSGVNRRVTKAGAPWRNRSWRISKVQSRCCSSPVTYV